MHIPLICVQPLGSEQWFWLSGTEPRRPQALGNVCRGDIRSCSLLGAGGLCHHSICKNDISNSGPDQWLLRYWPRQCPQGKFYSFYNCSLCYLPLERPWLAASPHLILSLNVTSLGALSSHPIRRGSTCSTQGTVHLSIVLYFFLVLLTVWSYFFVYCRLWCKLHESRT